MLNPTRPVIVTFEDGSTAIGRISTERLTGAYYPIIVMVTSKSSEGQIRESVIMCNSEGQAIQPYVSSVKNVAETTTTETCPHCNRVSLVEKPKPALNLLAPLFTQGGRSVKLLSYDISFNSTKKAGLPVVGLVFLDDDRVCVNTWTFEGKFIVGASDSDNDLTNTPPAPKI